MGYGAGIYLAKQSSMSLAYSGLYNQFSRTQPAAAAPASPALSRQVTGNRFLSNAAHLGLLAIREVVQAPTLKKFDWGYVAPDEDTVVTRFLLVFTASAPMAQNVTLTDAVVAQINKCMDLLSVGA